MHYLDCGTAFINAGGSGVNASMLPGDALHPNAAGYRALAACLDPTMRGIFAARGASRAEAGGRGPGEVPEDAQDRYADTCVAPDTTSAEARAFAARMAAAAAVTVEDRQGS